MLKRVKFYGAIDTHSEMKHLEESANKLDKHAVGINKDKLFKYDPKTYAAIIISKEEAAQILECDIIDIENLIKLKGNYNIPNSYIDETPAISMETPDEMESIDKELDDAIVETDATTNKIYNLVQEENKKLDEVLQLEKEIKDLLHK